MFPSFVNFGSQINTPGINKSPFKHAYRGVARGLIAVGLVECDVGKWDGGCLIGDVRKGCVDGIATARFVGCFCLQGNICVVGGQLQTAIPKLVEH